MEVAMQNCFNRYMVECEWWICTKSSSETRVLIDTWWNVNEALWNYKSLTCKVLIDTWWNVNYINYWQNNVRFICFNRYMVECECNWFMSICLGICVLIDTWWNVNLDEIMLRLAHDTVLIDTWWNVNLYEITLSGVNITVLIDTWWNVNVSWWRN